MPQTGEPSTSSSRLSTRISLRWLPDPAFETTDTVVMSVKDWYVDLRIDKQENQIDWAIAGQRIVESKNPLRVLFTHELDSHNTFEAADCGTFIDLPNGDSLETGQMPRLDIPGAPLADYEEVWRELTPGAGPEGSQSGVSWILESEDPGLSEKEGEVQVIKTFLGRVWGTYVALRQIQTHTRCQSLSGEWQMRKTGADVSARREEWDPNVGWCEKYVVGKDGITLPSLVAGSDNWSETIWRAPGKRIVIGETPFIVRACERI